MANTIIGVMGPGDDATQQDVEAATKLGQMIAQAGYVLLTGGRNVGVMEAASKGAKEGGGLTIGILPSEDKTGASQFVDIPICSGMGSARNNINVLSSDVVVACGSGAGTTSEIMLALKASKPIILLNPSKRLEAFINELPYPKPRIASSLDQAISYIHHFI